MTLNDAIKLVRAAMMENKINPNRVDYLCIVAAAREIVRAVEAGEWQPPSNVVSHPSTNAIAYSE